MCYIAARLDRAVTRRKRGHKERRMGLGRSRNALAALAVGCALTGSACLGERDPINQVQLGALPKAFFVGEKLDDASDDPEFYFRTTVVDVAAGAGAETLFTSSDSQPTTRIRWEITNDKLIARLSYELVDGTDKKGQSGAPRDDEPRGTPESKAPARTTTDGQIVASFKILKHFDIRRSYLPETGEESNVIVENDVDRPWTQRAYMRVDWSTNLVTDAYGLDAVSQMGLWGAVKWDPIAYNVDDPQSLDAPIYDLQNGYLDVTNKAFAAPQMVHDEEYGDFPACELIGAWPRISCNPSEVKLRLAFRRVVDTDYEAMDFDGSKMELFGYFTNDRFGYDRRYGVIDDKWHRFVSRWNVYERSHAEPVVRCATPETTPVSADPHRDADKDGTEDECSAVGRGSRCDEYRQACTIPLRDRKVRTIPWHVNREFPEELFASTADVVKLWSDAVRVGLLSGRVAECRRTKSGSCEAEMGWPKEWSDDFVPPLGAASPAEVPTVFVLCHNPVRKDEDPACGAEGTSPRMGDLRYNFLSFITSPQAASPWGIMVDAEDPLTGEKIAGSVNEWGATLDRAAGTLVDLVELLNGTTSPDAFIAGKDVSDWVRRMKEPEAPVGPSELTERMGAFDPSAMAPFATGIAKPAKATRRAPAAVRHKDRMQALSSAGKLGAGNAAIVQRMQKLRGSEIESKLVTPEMAQAAGLNPKEALSKSGVSRASPFSRGAPMMRRSLERRARTGTAQRHACRREAPEVDHLIGLAKKAQKLFGTVDPKNPAKVREHRDKIYQWAREKYSASVFSHEFGHAVGLRHNFAGTFDSLNYDDHYWQLRTKNGTVTKPCPAGTTVGDSCIGPRYLDPITTSEIDGGINGYASSSVMDYPGDQALDMFVMGKYDRAAVRFGYGGTVDVWNAPGLSTSGSGEGKRLAYELVSFDDPPGLFGVLSFLPPDAPEYRYLHYSQYQNEFDLIRDCQPDSQSPVGATCKGAPMDVVDYRDMKPFSTDPLYAEFFSTKAAVDPKGRVRRGYMFSSDEYADSGNVPAFSFDAGADAYEQVRFLESAYENRYVLDSFRRGRTMFNSYDVTARVQGHYLDTMQLIAKTFGFAMMLEVEDPANPPTSLLVDGNYGPLAMAASTAFDVFTRTLTRPEPGQYCSTGADDCAGIQPFGLLDVIYVADPFPLPDLTSYDFKIPLGTGRYVHNDFDYDKGYWWSDYQKQVGSFYDKAWAVYYLAEAFDSFISNSKEDFIDGRYKNVNFATIYPEQIRRLFASIVTGDVRTYAPWTTSTSQMAPAGLVYPAWRLRTDLGTRPASAKVIDPAYGWETQLYAMVWGSMLFPTSWSSRFIDDARITALASEQISWPAAETYVFIDPETGTTYRAHATGTEMLFGVEKQKSIGASMLDWANNLILEAYVVEVDPQGFYVFNADGTPKLKLLNGKPQLNPDFPGADGALRRYVANIEVMRQLTATFGRQLDTLSP